jgi:hypothetical protein
MQFTQNKSKEVQQEILAAVISVSEETLAAVMKNFHHQLQMVLDTNGAHTANVSICLTTELTKTKYSDICYIVMKLYATKTEISF